VFNISAMSYGALSPNAILALNAGAKRGSSSTTPARLDLAFHRQNGGDPRLGDRLRVLSAAATPTARSRSSASSRNAASDQVKMIEIKLLAGREARPRRRAARARKVTKEISDARGVPIGVDCISPAKHSAFLDSRRAARVRREAARGVGRQADRLQARDRHPWEWFGIAKAIGEDRIVPDFIVVDGGEGGTGAAPLEFTDHVGAPLARSADPRAQHARWHRARGEIRIGASAKVVTAFDIARTIAMGADWCNAARGFMFSLGCIQAQTCHTGFCPTGVTTQDPGRYRALVPEDKADRVYNYHQNTMKALKELIGARASRTPNQIGPEHIVRRVSATEVRSLAACITGSSRTSC
jgi:glutamate synthase domain-containing protein 2